MFRLAAETDRLAACAPRNQESGFGRFGTLFVHEWNVLGRDDSRDVSDHDARKRPAISIGQRGDDVFYDAFRQGRDRQERVDFKCGNKAH